MILDKSIVAVFSNGDPESQIRSAFEVGFTEPVVFLRPDEIQSDYLQQFQTHYVTDRDQAREILTSKYKDPVLFFDEYQTEGIDTSVANDSQEDPILVCIPARDCEELTCKCLEYLARYAGVPFHVLYIDDGSKTGVAGRVEAKADLLNLQIEVMRFEEPIRFAKACNIAFCRPGYRYVLLLNNDCFIGPDCLPRLRSCLQMFPETAAVNPLTADDGCLSIMKPSRRERVGIKTEIINRYDPIEGAELCQSDKTTCESMLPFFCTMFKVEAIAEIGLQDTHPDYAYGLGADDEWCERAINAGWDLRVCCNAFAAHLHKQSFKQHEINRSELTKTALKRLRDRSIKDPLLSIITRRHINRPVAFQRLCASIDGQTVEGTEHVILFSPGQIGIPGANRMLTSDDAVRKVTGDYVQVIDDDDILCSPEYVGQLQQFIIDQGYPDWIMVRGRINKREYPTPWGQEWQPKAATVACFCIITSRDLWNEHHTAWGVDKCGDWNFTNALWQAGNRPVWFDFEACQTQNGRSYGGAEIKERQSA